jgi:UDPglucose--hexose-1-phosphate uridylyltransferase
MEVAGIRQVVDAWSDQYAELGARPFINWVQIFENRGAQMCASNPHPHVQIWANLNPPNESKKEDDAQGEYHVHHESCLLCDYLALEMVSGERLVYVNDWFCALVPFWAIWPFETIILSKRHATGLDDLLDAERDALADVLKRITETYDKVFQVSFPYSMGFHQRPTDGAAHPEWHLHAHFYPPLLRSATVRKFMVGYNCQRRRNETSQPNWPRKDCASS